MVTSSSSSHDSRGACEPVHNSRGAGGHRPALAARKGTMLARVAPPACATAGLAGSKSAPRAQGVKAPAAKRAKCTPAPLLAQQQRQQQTSMSEQCAVAAAAAQQAPPTTAAAFGRMASPLAVQHKAGGSVAARG